MSIQLINLVFLVATINGVYSDVTIDIDGDFPTVVSSYPMTQPVHQFRIALVSDLEQDSKVIGSQSAWSTNFKKGSLFYNPNSNEVSATWDCGEEDGDEYFTQHSNTIDRGFELSDLTYFDGHLIAVDDQTGILYIYEGGRFKSWMVVPCKENHGDSVDSEGCSSKVIINSKTIRVMNIEWATVRGEYLIVGPNGNNGSIFAAKIDKYRNITFLNWKDEFKGLREQAEVPEGYLALESCVYSNLHEKFYLLPKKGSQYSFDETKDLKNSIHKLLSLTGNDDNTLTAKVETDIQFELGQEDRGYSAFQFVPETADKIIVALQTSDITNETYITAFTIAGKTVLNSTKVADVQFEGLAFL